MNTENARKIILNAVKVTEPTWTGYDVHWEDMDHVFLSRAYDQMGFDNWIFIDFLDKYELNIGKIGKILDKTDFERKYDRPFAGSLESPLYKNMKNGLFEAEGKRFYNSVKEFDGRKGQLFYKLLWYMLVTCHYLKNNYNSSFSNYLKIKYANYKGLMEISDKDFLEMSSSEWEDFKNKKQPWNELYGVGINVFDYIMGDIIELEFVKDSFKLDAANIRFLEKTGIIKGSELNHENVKQYLLSLDLPYTLREINKGLYTYASELGKENYGYCRTPQKCQECNVHDICEKNF
ncbi:hypothetical protein [Methanobacterium formicicum]|uniref:Uncharacterized protein n=1 Tax=Methanobacterium formicicum TaxID=2162 RepID=A0A843ARP4_METFO|nr:hypothetical protein [Methanobacterium formicicum]MBF4473944.1 hypothetical protein [Methanobacterium formicicum]